ncbi:MAG: hypothetical protein GX605_08415 [Chloroflexi bacterium]|nr:hypothetical protein [Chloroflexota bacterium]
MTRDPKTGQFLPGNPGGPGRGRRTAEERYLQALTRRVKLDDWRAIVDRAVADAKAGDDRARRWLSDYLIGKPTEYVQADVTTAGEPLQGMSDAELFGELYSLLDAARARQGAGADAGTEAPLG